jgi:DUF1680 family protein
MTGRRVREVRRVRVVRAVLVIAAMASVVVAAQTPASIVDYPITAVPMAAVKVTGGFWGPKLETNRTVTIPHIFDQNEKTGRTDNLRKGAGLMPGEYQGRRFNDTDVYKIIEAASFSLISHPDPALAAKIDDLIAILAKAQQPDGYLMPARTINPQKPAPGLGAERWEHENTGSHETYNSGHLIDAAVTHFMATGKKNLLDIATKNANLLRSVFGPTARVDAPGHEIVEMALVRLYKTTGDRRYFDLAKFFLDTRGTNHTASKDYTEASWQLYNDRPYRQDDKPLTQQTIGEGHAVRGVYVYAAMADMAAMAKDAAYNAAIDRIWQDVYAKRTYVTGGLGSVGGTEAFGAEYALPNRTAYTETCASVGAILWNHRMFQKSGEAKYLDAFEQTLYNGLLSGVSIKGDTFFYQNPLEANAGGAGRGGSTVAASMNAERRTPYFDVACCPANLARLIAQLPGLIYSTKPAAGARTPAEIYVNLFVDSEADVMIDGARVHITQKTNYPWDGTVRLTVTSTKAVNVVVRTRVPGWAGTAPFATDLYTFAGAPVLTSTTGWIDRRVAASTRATTWTTELPMPVRRVIANANLKEDAGKTALMRGPIVYALEGADNDGKVLDITLPAGAQFTAAPRTDLLGGVTTLTTKVGDRTITAIPYFAWANRARGEMVVWVKQER